MKLLNHKPNVLERIKMRQAAARGEKKMPSDKGEYLGSCNRSACLKAGAVWFNHSTRRYYCEDCAHWLNTNDFNRRDALRLWGHDLCTLGEQV